MLMDIHCPIEYCSINKSSAKAYDLWKISSIVNSLLSLACLDHELWFEVYSLLSWRVATDDGGRVRDFSRYRQTFAHPLNRRFEKMPGWFFGRNPPFTAFFSMLSSLSRPCASSRPHHAWEAYVSLAMKVRLGWLPITMLRSDHVALMYPVHTSSGRPELPNDPPGE